LTEPGATDKALKKDKEVSKEMLVGISGKSAGDFTQYQSKCDLFKDGWKLFRPEAYDILLME